MVSAPPALSASILQACFAAGNGELGVRLGDVDAFLDVCAVDDLAILGWEAWIVDHVCDPAGRSPHPSPGHWCGLIPSASGSVNIIRGETGARDSAERWRTYVNRTVAETRDQLASFDPVREVGFDWRQHLRVNFTLMKDGAP